MTIRVSTTEPPSLRAIGRTTNMPELYGGDVLWPSRLGLVALQRKVFPEDFVDSLHDGRLSEQRARMQRAAVRILVLEGRGTWTTDGELVVPFGPGLTLSQFRRYLWSVQLDNIWISHTSSLAETVDLVQDMEAWTNKVGHSKGGRPKPKGSGGWGPNGRDFQVHLMESFDGIGADTAGRIVDHFDGPPLAWTVTAEEMMQVHGVGRGRASKMMEMLP